jgi:hypothetical protein
VFWSGLDVSAGVVLVAVADPGLASAPSVRATASPTAVPAPTYPANVMDVPDFSPLEVETYFVEPDATDIQVFYTIPAEGWNSWFGALKSYGAISIVNVTNVVQEGCTAHGAADPPVGPTVARWRGAGRLSPFVTKPSDVTIDGFSGNTWADRSGPRSSGQQRRHHIYDCTAGELKSWIGDPLSYAFHGYSYPGQVEEIWLLDVGGTRLMIEALWSPGSPEGDIAELRSILDSIDIVP